MHIIIGLAAGVALLYFWLIGHWFARVLMFMVLATVFGFLGASWLTATQDAAAAAPAPGIIGAILGTGAAWYVASIPLWIERAKAKQRRWHEAEAMRQATTHSAALFAPVDKLAARPLALVGPYRSATD